MVTTESCSNSQNNSNNCTSRSSSKAALDSELYLGLDLSTQQLKAVVVNHQLDILHEANVHFDTDFPQFRTEGGVHRHEDPHVVTAPCLMWTQALDLVLERLKQTGLNFALVKAVSGSGQQHGSVYWKKGAEKILSSLSPEKCLGEQLANAFSTLDSPIWMDSSTGVECKQLEDAVGGPEQLAAITGSRAYERFTGSQILKIRKNQPRVYKETERISLVSSYVASLFLGSYAPIDISDGSGMNLMDIHTKEWNETLVHLISEDLPKKLGKPVPTGQPVGPISNYFVRKFGFSSECTIASFTGDNPASLVGMALRDGDVAISLGTSDTVFVWIDHPKPNATHGHILCNPLDQSAYLALLCYKNGSQTRERIKKVFADGSWDTFSNYLINTPRGNEGQIGFYFDLKEIYPLLMGDYRFDRLDQFLKSNFASNAHEIRACIEGQFLRLKTHAMDLGYRIHKDTRILATGGASANKEILQVLADVFNADVYVQEKPNSAALGGAYLARLAKTDDNSGKEALNVKSKEYKLAASAASDADAIYPQLESRYRKLEKVIQNNLAL